MSYDPPCGSGGQVIGNPVGGPVVLEHIAGLYELEPIWVMHRKHHNPGEGYQPFIE
jgi:hypothetical protein